MTAQTASTTMASTAAPTVRVCCYHASISYVDTRSGEFELIRVTRDQPGYEVVTTYPGLQDATQRADQLNEHAGVDPRTKRDIITSSIAAGRAQRTLHTQGGDPPVNVSNREPVR